MSKTYQHAVSPDFPVDYWVEGDRAYVLKNKSTDSTFAVGDEIISVNRVPAKDIIREAKAAQSRDGYGETFPYYFLNLYTFEDIAWRVFDVKPPYKFEIAHPDGRLTSHIVTRKPRPKNLNASLPAIQKSDTEKKEEELKKSRRLEVLDSLPSTAILTVHGFGYEDAYEFHKQAFKGIAEKKIKSLIIDIRGNPGGNLLNAVDLMSYLTDTTFYVNRQSWAKLRNPNNPSFAQYFESSTKQLLTDNTKFLYKKAGKYYFETGGMGPQQSKKENIFKGKLYLLTGGFTFSAGALFAAAVKEQLEATFIGQETGGGQAGCSGGIIQTLTLPYTKLRVGFPLFRVLSVSGKPLKGRGVLPDYPITYHWKEKSEGRDLELEMALELIKKGD